MHATAHWHCTHASGGGIGAGVRHPANFGTHGGASFRAAGRVQRGCGPAFLRRRRRPTSCVCSVIAVTVRQRKTLLESCGTCTHEALRSLEEHECPTPRSCAAHNCPVSTPLCSVHKRETLSDAHATKQQAYTALWRFGQSPLQHTGPDRGWGCRPLSAAAAAWTCCSRQRARSGNARPSAWQLHTRCCVQAIAPAWSCSAARWVGRVARERHSVTQAQMPMLGLTHTHTPTAALRASPAPCTSGLAPRVSACSRVCALRSPFGVLELPMATTMVKEFLRPFKAVGAANPAGMQPVCSVVSFRYY